MASIAVNPSRTGTGAADLGEGRPVGVGELAATRPPSRSTCAVVIVRCREMPERPWDLRR